VKPFWGDIKRWIHTETGSHINLSHTEVILGTPDDISPVFDLFYITAKMHIYACKHQNTLPKLEGFIKRIELIKLIEKYIAIKNNKLHLFNQKWFIDNNDNTYP
jgi:hypothetical protein